MRPKDFRARIASRLRRARVEAADTVTERLGNYFRLLTHWNERINLTSLGATDQAIDRLIVEPLIAARHLHGFASSIIDIGSGSGSPAIPMKIASGGPRLLMVESKARKSAFLREAIRVLDLRDTSVETARYEELLARPDLVESSDVLTIRAVRVEAKVLTGLQAFLVPGGRLLLFRGPSGPDVPQALTPPLAWNMTVPLVESLRSRLVILEKTTVGPPRRSA